jgi:hypothetical protein
MLILLQKYISTTRAIKLFQKCDNYKIYKLHASCKMNKYSRRVECFRVLRPYSPVLNTCELASPRGFFLKRGVLVESVRPLVPSLCLCSNESAGTSLSRSRYSRDEALGGGDSPMELQQYSD